MDTAITTLAEDRLKTGLSGLMLIPENHEAFAARVLSARGATSTLDLMYYIWYDDHAGRLLMNEVLNAARRGVKVRILLDDINPQSSDAAYLALNNEPNIELRLFNPSGMRNGSIFRGLEMVARMFAMTRRMHNKAWIADGTSAIVGGRNVGNAYFDAAETNFRDLDVLLVGKAVKDTLDIFEAFWNCPASRRVDLLNPKARPRRLKGLRIPRNGDDDLMSSLKGRQSIGEMIAAETNAMHWVADARVISDPPHKVMGRRRRNWLARQIVPIIREARHDVDIVSPYFVPGRKGARILADLVNRGVSVDILTNSLAATDVAVVHGAYSNYRRRLLRAGVRLYELSPFGGQAKISVFGSKGASLHTKAFSVDGRTGFVGSFNFDPRSVSLNAEMGVLFEDEGLVKELRNRFAREKAPEISYRLRLDGPEAPIWRRGRLAWDGVYEGEQRHFTHEPEATFPRRMLARLVRWLPIESQL